VHTKRRSEDFLVDCLVDVSEAARALERVGVFLGGLVLRFWTPLDCVGCLRAGVVVLREVLVVSFLGEEGAAVEAYSMGC
jgi:hypothetical protein